MFVVNYAMFSKPAAFFFDLEFGTCHLPLQTSLNNLSFFKFSLKTTKNRKNVYPKQRRAKFKEKFQSEKSDFFARSVRKQVYRAQFPMFTHNNPSKPRILSIETEGNFKILKIFQKEILKFLTIFQFKDF